MARRACGRPVPAAPPGGTRDCTYERMKGKQMCHWHWLLKQSADLQRANSEARLQMHLHEPGFIHRDRVPKEEWPSGERWCAGCQSFVPLFYTTGSRCKACASTAAHQRRTERVYGLSPEDYDALFRFQRGRCYICQRQPRTKRLAVDHDHKTGEVRGLLCANNENGCNRAVVANLEAAVDGGLEAARRAVLYLEHPPYARMKGISKVERVVGGLREDPPAPQPPPF